MPLIFDQAVAGYGRMVLGVSPTVYGAGAPVPTVLYCHGAGGLYDNFTASPQWEPLRDWLLENGWAWVEGTGGVDDAGGQYNWGNQNARDAYLAYLAQAGTILDVGTVVVLGRSMGGMVGSWLATQSPIAGDVAGFIANSAVGSMFVGGDYNDPDPMTQNMAVFAGSAIRTAYGISDPDPAVWYPALQVAAADYAPELYDPAVWTGRNALFLYGDNDVTVPWWPRGWQEAREDFSNLLAYDQVALKPGGTHGTAVGTYDMVDQMGAFLERTVGSFPVLPTGAVPVWEGTPGASSSVLPYPPVVSALPGAPGVIDNPGNIEGPVILRINGPCTNPRVTHVTAAGTQTLGLTCDLPTAGHYVWVDVEKRNVLANLVTPRPEWVTERGWGLLEPGENAWIMTADTHGEGAGLVVTATPAYQ